jgi:flagellar FliL protein
MANVPRSRESSSQPATGETEQLSLQKPRNSRKRLALTVLGAVVLVSSGLTAAWASGLLPKLWHRPAALMAGPVFLPVPEIITNLNGSNGQDSYAKLKVTLEVPNVQAAKLISKAMPRFVDMFQTYLRAMHPSELRGASGTYRLREELVMRARIVAAPVPVQNVLFEELIVQ